MRYFASFRICMQSRSRRIRKKYNSSGQWLVMQTTLATYDPSRESVQTSALISACLTQPCANFVKNLCPFHRPPSCFYYHTGLQQRRPVIGDSNRILYWDQLCPAYFSDGSCSEGDSCEFAHSKSEVAYHPARFRTRICNGTECRGSVCCFAHCHEELRPYAPKLYGHAVGDPSSPLSSGRLSDAGSTCASVSCTATLPITRLCDSYPALHLCAFGHECGLAHDWSELITPILSVDSLDFFVARFKTQWCVFAHAHDWNNCVYAHTWQDYRRPPSVGYGPAPCPLWEFSDTRIDYQSRCANGFRCPFAHGRKEQLYHPSFYKTQECCDWRRPAASPHSCCMRGPACAFYHGDAEIRLPGLPSFDYLALLDEAQVDAVCIQAKPALVAAKRLQGSPENLNMEDFLNFAL